MAGVAPGSCGAHQAARSSVPAAQHNQKAGCLLPSRPAPARHMEPVRSLRLSCEAWNPQPPLSQLVPKFHSRTCPRAHPCFSVPTATGQAQLRHHVLPGLLPGLESHLSAHAAARGFSPASPLGWLPVAAGIKSSYWKPSPSCLALPQPQRTDSQSSSARVRRTLLHCLCRVAHRLLLQVSPPP